MWRHVRVVAGAAIAGFILGVAVGSRHWCWAWPRLSFMAAMKAGALGWLIGLALALALSWTWFRRAPGRMMPHQLPRWRKLGRALLGALALAPAGLWLTMAAPEGFMREAMASGRRRRDTRANLVFITIDALRPDYVGTYGNRESLTPNIDDFAREATQYQSAYVPSPWTLTSFGMLFTSLPPAQCGLKTPAPQSADWYRWSAMLPANISLLPERLQRAGYTTAAELTNAFLDPARGWSRGFDYFRNEGGEDSPTVAFTVAQPVTERALAWLKLNRRQPFFLWVHYLDPHVPYDSPDTPAQLRARYPPQWVAKRKNWYEYMQYADDLTQAHFQEFCREMYAEEVRYADRWVGALLEGLRAAELYDDSLVVITADHGEELFDHGGFEHGHNMHEEVLWVPLLVKWPKGVDADGRVTQTVAWADLAGTLLESAKVPPVSPGEKRSLPKRDGARSAEVYSEAILFGIENTALTTDHYKVIYHPYETSEGGKFEVYDRRRDRRERSNLAPGSRALNLQRRLRELTEAAQAHARRWQEERGQEGRRGPLSEQMRQRLRDLGYLGN